MSLLVSLRHGGTVALIEKCSGAVEFEAVATEHRWVVHISGGNVGRGDLTPDREAVGQLGSPFGRAEQMPSRPEVCGDADEGAQEPLRMPRRFEAFHRPFALSGGLIRVLGAVQIPRPPVLHRRHELAVGDLVAADRYRPREFGRHESDGAPDEKESRPKYEHLVTNSAAVTSSDPQTVVYKLNPKAVWSDGTPITADDFIYNWQAQSGNPAYTDVGNQPYDDATTSGYNQIASVVGSDPSGGAACDPGSTANRNAGLCPNGRDVTVTFKPSFADWRSLYTNIVPAHIAADGRLEHRLHRPDTDDLG